MFEITRKDLEFPQRRKVSARLREQEILKNKGIEF
jgi:hypothetical protein